MKDAIPVVAEDEVRRAQEQLVRSLDLYFEQDVDILFSTRGSKRGPTLLAGRRSQDQEFGFYWTKADKAHYWNAFGLYQGGSRSYAPIVECNIPVDGEDLRQGALFATPKNGSKPHLVHTGKIGGGGEGIGKKQFLAWLDSPARKKRLRWTRLLGRSKGKPAIDLGAVDSPNLGRSVITLMELVDAFKKSRKQKPKKPKPNNKKGKRLGKRRRKTWPKGALFKGEPFPSKTKRKGPETVTREHGKIVKALQTWAEAALPKQQTLGVGNQGQMDLYIVRNKGNRLQRVFEVKTHARFYDFYAGIGQLLIYSAMENARFARKTLVMPRDEVETDPEHPALAVLRNLNIDLLTYKKTKKGYRFGTFALN